MLLNTLAHQLGPTDVHVVVLVLYSLPLGFLWRITPVLNLIVRQMILGAGHLPLVDVHNELGVSCRHNLLAEDHL